MTITNPPKALIALVGLLCVTLLMAVQAIDSTAGMPIITLIMGYAVGNGVAARQNQLVEPIIGPKKED
jgi:hypothetical protein